MKKLELENLLISTLNCINYVEDGIDYDNRRILNNYLSLLELGKDDDITYIDQDILQSHIRTFTDAKNTSYKVYESNLNDYGHGNCSMDLKILKLINKILSMLDKYKIKFEFNTSKNTVYTNESDTEEYSDYKYKLDEKIVKLENDLWVINQTYKHDASSRKDYTEILNKLDILRELKDEIEKQNTNLFDVIVEAIENVVDDKIKEDKDNTAFKFAMEFMNNISKKSGMY